MSIAKKMLGSLLLVLLLAEIVDAASLTLTWTDNSAAELAQDIDRCAGNACTNFVKLTSVAANVQIYVDQNLAELSIFCYRVRATAGAVFSTYSNSSCNNTGLNSPGTSLNVTQGP